jgi:8-oxo-dGTP diphosphatase
LYTFNELDRDPFNRVISVAYFALIPAENVILKTTSKYSDIKWWPMKELPNLAYDHQKIAKYGQKRLKWKVTYTNAIWSLLPEEFSLSQLQNSYESVLGKTLDKRNFRKKILSLKIIQETGNKVTIGAHRPAKLYKFSTKEPEIIEII